MAESPGKMYALATILAVLAIIAVILRFRARQIKKTNLSWDDYLVFAALVFSIVTAICMVIGASLGDLGRHTIINPRTHRPHFTRRTEVFLQVEYAIWLTQTLTFGLTKLSVLAFYKRIFRGTVFDTAVWVNVAIVSIWTISFFFTNVFQCWPISVNWHGWGASDSQCVNTNMMYLAQAYSDVFTDVLILSLPIPNVWALKMPARHKIAIASMFLLGALTVCASIAKLVVFHQIIAETQTAGVVDVTYVLTPSIYWPMVESSLGIVGACLPLLRPLVAGITSEGFMRSLRSIVFPSTANHSGRSYPRPRNPMSPDADAEKMIDARSPRLGRVMRFSEEDGKTLGEVSPVLTFDEKMTRRGEEESALEGNFGLEVHGLPITPIGDLEQQRHSYRLNKC